MRSHRLEKAYTALDDKKVKIVSLDIFDTLLWRKVAKPEDVFLILGRKLKEEGWLIPAVTAENFALMRKEAEKEARFEKKIRQGSSEVTLAEIYWQLSSAFVKLSAQEMIEGKKKGIFCSDTTPIVDLELLLEKQLIEFDENILELALYAQSKNVPVILVSDTYFEEGTIRDFLAERLLPDHLFLSCEWGKGKQEGLFEYVIDTLKIAPDQILHIGDNEKSDVRAASKKGMQTVHYQKYARPFEEILKREWREDLQKRLLFLDPSQGDFGLTSLRAKLYREDQFFWSYGATVLGPVLFGFIHWIYVRCQEMGVSEVFCLMREGKLYAELIERFAPYFPEHRLTAKHLWVSRLFITHAAMGFGSKTELSDTVNAFLERFTVEQVCEYLGLEITQLKKWEPYRHVMLENGGLRKQFVTDLVSDGLLHKQILKTASAKRKRFTNYLSSLIDLSSEQQMTLVDVGWSGTVQKALQRIFQLENSPLHLHGLYLGTTESGAKCLIQGVACESYLCKGDFPPNKIWCYVIEETATSETGMGSLKDIDEEGRIINYPTSVPQSQRNEAKMVQEGIFAFFELAGSRLKGTSPSLEKQLKNIFIRSMVNVTPEEAEHLGSWFHEHGSSSSYLTQVLAKDSYYDHFIKDMFPSAAFKESGLNWAAAYAAKHSKYLAKTSEVLWLKQLPPRCFLSEDSFEMKIFVDTGKDFSQKAAQVLELRSNPNRNFYAHTKLSSTKKAIKRLQLALEFPKALVRIRSVRLTVFDKSRPEPEEMVFFESDSGDQMSFSAKSQVSFNTFESDQGLQLMHTFEKEGVYHIKLKLCCEMFRL